MNEDKKLWAMDAREFAEYAKTASKAELAEYKSMLPQYIEYLQAELRKYEAEQKALKGAGHRLGLHLMEQLLKKAKGEIPAQNNAGKNAQWGKNTSKFCLIALSPFLTLQMLLKSSLVDCYILSCDCYPPLNPLRRGRGLFSAWQSSCSPSLAEGARGWVKCVDSPCDNECVDCHENPCGFSRNDDSTVDSPSDREQSCVSVPLNADFSRLCLYLVRLSLADFRCFVPLSIRENASSSLLTMRL